MEENLDRDNIDKLVLNFLLEDEQEWLIEAFMLFSKHKILDKFLEPSNDINFLSTIISLCIRLAQVRKQLKESNLCTKVKSKKKKPVVKSNRFKVVDLIDPIKTIIFDTKTRLEWTLGPDKAMSHIAASKWIELVGKDWRFPTLKELKTLYIECEDEIVNIYPEFKMSGLWVWSELDDKINGYAWQYSFVNGQAYKDYSERKDSHIRVFAVRKVENAC